MSELEKKLQGIRNGGQHAFLVTAQVKNILPILREGIQKVFNKKIDTDPDYFEFVTENFDIEEARKIRTASQKASMGGVSRIFVVCADNFLEKAQSALLKTLEEPIPGHYFFIITPNEDGLMLTLKSRVQKINFVPEVALGDVLSEKFLTSALQDRLLMVSDIIDDDAEPSTQRIAIKNFIINLKRKIFYEYKGRDFYDKKNFEQVMTEISKAEKYSGDVSSAPRLLLEFLAFICPRAN